MPRGGFGRGFGGRRFGAPLIVPMGGYRWGMGSPLLSTLIAGGLGYALGSNSAQQSTPPYPPNPYPQQTQTQSAPVPDSENTRLAQLQLLNRLHEVGTLTDEEFECEKQRILRV